MLHGHRGSRNWDSCPLFVFCLRGQSCNYWKYPSDIRRYSFVYRQSSCVGVLMTFTHWRQSRFRQLCQLLTRSRFCRCFEAVLSKIDCRRLIWLYRTSVERQYLGLSLVTLFRLCRRPYTLATKSNSTACRGRHCPQSWTCSTRSTSSKVGDFCCPNVERPFDMVDFVESRPCRLRLCRQCIPGLKQPEARESLKDWTLSSSRINCAATAERIELVFGTEATLDQETVC